MPYSETIGVDIWENVLIKFFPEEVRKENLAAFSFGRKA